VKEALCLDLDNGDTMWQDAVEKELKQINDFHTFNVLPPGEGPPAGYQKVPYHFIFDVKFDLRRKARLVAGGNWTELEREDIYSGVVALETVRTGFFLGQLNNLSCCAGDIGNAFLMGTTRERMYMHDDQFMVLQAAENCGDIDLQF
jgi:hypothetical protein